MDNMQQRFKQGETIRIEPKDSLSHLYVVEGFRGKSVVLKLHPDETLPHANHSSFMMPLSSLLEVSSFDNTKCYYVQDWFYNTASRKQLNSLGKIIH